MNPFYSSLADFGWIPEQASLVNVILYVTYITPMTAKFFLTVTPVAGKSDTTEAILDT